MKWTIDGIACLMLIAGCLCLLILNHDGEVKSILTMAAGWLFGSQYQMRRTTIEK